MWDRKKVLTVHIITSEDELRTLRVVWDELLEKSVQHSPFLTYDWFQCCLANPVQEIEQFILVVKDGGEVIGIAPFQKYQDKFHRLKIRKIGFINCPDTPLADFIIQKERSYEVIQKIIYFLYGEKREAWDVLTLSQFPRETVNSFILQEILRNQRQRFLMKNSSFIPYISIQGGWEEFLRTRSGRFRKTHRNIVNRISKLKQVEIQCARHDATGAVMQALLEISRRSWKEKNGVAISSREEVQRFFATLTKLASQKGWLLVWLLKINGAPVAMEYDLQCAGVVYALRTDFDETYKEYSPGTYLQYQIIKNLFENEYIEYSFGPGWNTYKTHWTKESYQHEELYVFNRNLKVSMIWALESKLFPFLKRLKKEVNMILEIEKKFAKFLEENILQFIVKFIARINIFDFILFYLINDFQWI
jgi:CelD/BcsL family acetyltransferase involved in cellulose biosynthesis